METPGAAPPSDQLRQILEQVKSGSKNRQEAFEELRSILQTNTASKLLGTNTASSSSSSSSSASSSSSSATPQSAEGDYKMSPAVNDDAVSISSAASSKSGVASRMSAEERRHMINKLAEKNRQQQTREKEYLSSPSMDIVDMVDQNLMRDARKKYGGLDDWVHSTEYNMGGREEDMQEYRDDAWESGGDSRQYRSSSFDDLHGHNHHHYGHPQHYHHHNRDSIGSGGSVEPGTFIDRRHNRVQQTERVIRNEMYKEFTFKPQIKELPATYGSGKDRDRETPFYQRVTKWQREKEQETSKQRQNFDRMEVADCTFRPRINKNSELAVKELRGNVNESINDRLYKNGELAAAQREKLVEDELIRERAEEDRECTFQPHFRTAKSKFTEVKRKYDAPARPKTAQPYSEELKKCTFTPQVKGVRPSMSSAKQYVSTNVVERLTRPPVSAAAPADDTLRAFDLSSMSYTAGMGGDYRPVMDIHSFISMQTDGNSRYRTPSQQVRSSSAPHQRRASTGDLSNKQKEKLDLFLGRQQKTLMKKERHVEEGLKASTPAFKPKMMGRKSQELSDRNHKGEFLERLERDVIKRVDRPTREVPGESFTFQPHINPSSEKRRPRSAQEMSRGDAIKHQSAIRMMILKSEQEELSELTFRPEITKKAKKLNKSYLKIQQDPAKPLALHEERISKREKIYQQHQQEKAQQEVSQCTFKPEVKSCPAYVKRIAKSMEIVREVRKAEMEKTGPKQERKEWK